MSPENLQIPEFLLCELPIKNNSIDDQRQWIYCPSALSLIEVIPEDVLTVAVNRDLFQQKFKYLNSYGLIEEFNLVVIQNNLEMLNINPIIFLGKAWSFYEDYLRWEDQNINNSGTTSQN